MEPRVLAEGREGRVLLQAILGDLTREEVDAIINAANSYLAHGGGLAGAIVHRGGGSIQTESDTIAPVAVGDAVVTGAGLLPCRHVIHAVGPRWGDGDEEALLRSAVSASLDRAHEIGARSIAVPAVSTGIFGYPKAAGTRTIVDETRRWLRAHPGSSLQAIRLTAFDRETAELFAQALAGSDEASIGSQRPKSAP
jgi:O-acetyl-ADP-ribose deacetylase (regulator of RNase III)